MSRKKPKPEDFVGVRFDTYAEMWDMSEALADAGIFGLTHDDVRLRGGRVVFEGMTVEAWNKKYPNGIPSDRPDVTPDE